jgi:hypothetical protein
MFDSVSTTTASLPRQIASPPRQTRRVRSLVTITAENLAKAHRPPVYARGMRPSGLGACYRLTSPPKRWRPRSSASVSLL